MSATHISHCLHLPQISTLQTSLEQHRRGVHRRLESWPCLAHPARQPQPQTCGTALVWPALHEERSSGCHSLRHPATPDLINPVSPDLSRAAGPCSCSGLLWHSSSPTYALFFQTFQSKTQHVKSWSTKKALNSWQFHSSKCAHNSRYPNLKETLLGVSVPLWKSEKNESI